MSSTDQNVINKRDIEITFYDGPTFATSTNTYTVTGEEGDLALDGGGVSVESYLDRGELIGDAGYPLSRKVDDQPCSLSLTAYLRKITDATVPTLRDIAARLSNMPSAACGAAANWSNQHAFSDAYHIGVRVKIYRSGSNVSGYFTLDYDYCTGTMTISDGSPATLALTLTSHKNAPIIAVA